MTADESDEGARPHPADEDPSAEPVRTLPALEGAQRAFDVGDYAEVRRLVSPLLEDSDPDVRAAAASLQRRIGVDPFQVGLLVACLAFFVYITWHYVF